MIYGYNAHGKCECGIEGVYYAKISDVIPETIIQYCPKCLVLKLTGKIVENNEEKMEINRKYQDKPWWKW